MTTQEERVNLCLEWFPSEYRKAADVKLDIPGLPYHVVQRIIDLIPIESLVVSMKQVEEIMSSKRAKRLYQLHRGRQCLYHTSKENRNDKQTVIIAIRKDPKQLQFANRRFLHDIDVLMEATSRRQSPDGLEWVLLHLPNDVIQNNISKLVEANSDITMIEKFSELGLSQDYQLKLLDITLTLIPKSLLVEDGMCLEVAQEFKNNRNLVLIAVRQNGLAIQFAHDSLKEDKGVALCALHQNASCFQYIGESLKNDPSIAWNAVFRDPTNFEHLPPSLKENKRLVMTTIKQMPEYFNKLSDQLKEDSDIYRCARSYLVDRKCKVRRIQ